MDGNYLTFNNNTTALTVITGCFSVRLGGFVKITASYVVNFQAFRAISVFKFVFGNCQVTVPTTNFIGFFSNKRKYFVFAVFHKTPSAKKVVIRSRNLSELIPDVKTNLLK